MTNLQTRLDGDDYCSEDCKSYPHYGVAPHECFFKKGADKTIGQSTLLPTSEWPESFVPDLEDGETAETIQYPYACGMYYCPDCLRGKPNDQ